jgi:chlorite dismutase
VSYYGYKWIRWTAWKENRREQLREALFHIEDVLDEARGIPNIDTAKLKKAKEKIDELLKEAQKV